MSKSGSVEVMARARSAAAAAGSPLISCRTTASVSSSILSTTTITLCSFPAVSKRRCRLENDPPMSGEEIKFTVQFNDNTYDMTAKRTK